MIYNAYEILGLTESATMEEVEQRYQQLRDKLQGDRFLPGDEGEEASEKLQQLEVAYRDIKLQHSEKQQAQTFTEDADYTEIQELIKSNLLDEAQSLLDGRTNRDAEWHYIQSILFYKRNWFLESKAQLELACQMEPNNSRYKQSLEKLTKILASNTISPDQLRTTSRPVDDHPQVDNNAGVCLGNCARCVACSLCCDCCMPGGCI